MQSVQTGWLLSGKVRRLQALSLVMQKTSSLLLASYPGPSQKKREAWYTLFVHARNYSRLDSYNSVPYCKLYPWTVSKRPFYCLGVALRVWPPVVRVFSFSLPLSTLSLKLEKKVALLCV